MLAAASEKTPAKSKRYSGRTRGALTPASVQARLDACGIERICSMVASGLTMYEIAETMNVSSADIHDWKCRLDRAEPQLRVSERFANALSESAEALLDRGLIGLQNADETSNAAVNKWRYVAMEYARRAGIRNQRYAERQSVELTGKDGGPIQSQAVVTVYVPANYRDDPKVIGHDTE